jgi:tetratricopeptide (TPR) repeat protein
MGEPIYPVSPLAVPDAPRASTSELEHSSSVMLFVERAKAVRPAFALNDDNAHAVAAICRHLDGLPLAIELAAARINLLSPNAMLKRLPHRMNLLAGGRDVPIRWQTIRDTIAWTYDLLNQNERELFSALAVFSGSFSLESAEVVCEASRDVLGSLVEKRLVREQSERLVMLETIRAFALERLDESGSADPLRGRHAAHFAALVDDAHAERGDDEKGNLDELELEHDNVQSALDWMRTEAPFRFVQIAGKLGWFWHLHSHFSEGRSYLGDAIAMAVDADETRARVLSSAGELAAWAGDVQAARASIEEAATIWRGVGRDDEIASALLELGWGCYFGGDEVSARGAMEESVRMARRVGERSLINRARVGLLQMLVAHRELEAVEPMAEEALRDAERQGDIRSEHFAHHFLADCPLVRGDAAAAAPRYRRALELANALGDRSETAIEIQGVAMAAAGMSLPARGLMLAGAASAEFDRLGIDRTRIKFWNALLERYLEPARRALGEREARAAWEAGRRMEFECAVRAAMGN